MAKFVTTLAQKQLETHGEKLFKSWRENASGQELLVFIDKPEEVENTDSNIHFKRIENPAYYQFLEKHKGNPAACGVWQNGYEYRLDTVRFCHKIYAISEGVKYLTDKDELYVWWDADAWLTAPITSESFKELLSPVDWVGAYLGRKDWDHTETGFIAFNMKNPESKNMINAMVKLYDSGNVFKLSQGRTDSCVYDVVREAYTKQRGQKFLNLSEGVSGSHVWPNTVLAKFSEHAKGPEAKSKIYGDNTITAGPQSTLNQTATTEKMGNRYDQIYKMIEFTKPKIIAEVGVARGDRAVSMIEKAFKYVDRVIYFGFDIFEDGDEELNKKEMNGKKVSPLSEVENRLKALQKKYPNLFFTLYKGNTNDTLPAYVNKYITLKNSTGINLTVTPSMADLAFIDGGHSVETIRNDYLHFSNVDLILLDDYYIPDQRGNCPDTTKFGCNFLEKELEVFKPLPIADPVRDGGLVKMVATGKLAKGIEIKTKDTKSAPNQVTQSNMKNANGKGVKIETKNSIPNEVLQSQADNTCKVMKQYNIPEVQSCELHERWAYLIGGAPSYKKPENIEEIKKASLNNGIVFSSKTAHDYLISQGIVPWGCLLLDPRPHVADHFEIHPDVKYFVASQCHPDVFDKLIKGNANIHVYHAEVAAGERDIILGHFPNARMLAGGSTSQSRGISVLMLMGFYKFKLFGLDSSYPEKPTKVHGINQEKQPIEITVNDTKTKQPLGGGKFWTDPELLAQINDMEHITKIFGHLKLECKSEGLMKTMLEHWLKEKRSFEELYSI